MGRNFHPEMITRMQDIESGKSDICIIPTEEINDHNYIL